MAIHKYVSRLISDHKTNELGAKQLSLSLSLNIWRKNNKKNKWFRDMPFI